MCLQALTVEAKVSSASGLRIIDLRLNVAATGNDIVDGIDLTIEKGRVLGLVGESGSGKTTVGLAVTYADYAAYEATVGYDAFTAYLNGDENDTFQNVGVGYSAAVQGADVYAEVGYNLDTEEFTPAVGVSINF